MRIQAAIVATGVLSFAISGCADRPTSPQLGAPSQASRTVTANTSEPPGSHAAIWRGYSSRVPGFGGMYFDEIGDLVVVLKDTTDVRAASSVFASFVGQSHRPADLAVPNHVPSMRFVQGKYDYEELLGYKESVSRALRGLASHLSSISIDERANTVRIGVVDSTSSAESILAATALNGVPESAVSVVSEARMTNTTSQVYINDHVTPIVGGFRLAMGGSQYCTVGFPVTYGASSTPGILTAGHCTVSVGDSAGEADRLWVTHNEMAVVATGHNTYTCSHGSNCKYADAALLSINSGVSYYLGGVAHEPYVAIGSYYLPGLGWTVGAYYIAPYGDSQAYDQTSGYGTVDGPWLTTADITTGSEVTGQWKLPVNG